MTKRPETSEERLAALGRSLAAIEPQAAVPKHRLIAPKPKVALGSKTRMILWVMAWLFRLSWLLWVALFFLTSPPKTLSHFWLIPFSAFCFWLIYLGHRHIIIAAARAATKVRRSV